MRFALVVCVVVAGCGSPIPVNLDQAKLEGCRSPIDDGCERCCAPDGNGDFIIMSGETDWYNGGDFNDGSCPSALPACAQCSDRNEAELRDLSDDPVCNCDGVDPGNDPCFIADSCECFCQRLEFASDACAIE